MSPWTTRLARLAFAVALAALVGTSASAATADAQSQDKGDQVAAQTIDLTAAPGTVTTPQNAVTTGQERIEGRVVSRQSRRITVRADDGRRLAVDMTQVPVDVRQRIRVNQRVTVIGELQGKQMAARTVEIDANRRAMERRRNRDDGAASPRTAGAAPRSKDDCKDNGWSAFTDPTFRNQGDCVSWVNRQQRERKTGDRR